MDLNACCDIYMWREQSVNTYAAEEPSLPIASLSLYFWRISSLKIIKDHGEQSVCETDSLILLEGGAWSESLVGFARDVVDAAFETMLRGHDENDKEDFAVNERGRLILRGDSPFIRHGERKGGGKQ